MPTVMDGIKSPRIQLNGLQNDQFTNILEKIDTSSGTRMDLDGASAKQNI